MTNSSWFEPRTCSDSLQSRTVSYSSPRDSVSVFKIPISDIKNPRLREKGWSFSRFRLTTGTKLKASGTRRESRVFDNRLQKRLLEMLEEAQACLDYRSFGKSAWGRGRPLWKDLRLCALKFDILQRPSAGRAEVNWNLFLSLIRDTIYFLLTSNTQVLTLKPSHIMKWASKTLLLRILVYIPRLKCAPSLDLFLTATINHLLWRMDEPPVCFSDAILTYTQPNISCSAVSLKRSHRSK